MESKMWDSISDLGDLGNKMIESLRKQQWFRGWQGIPLGCNAKPITLAALRACRPISEDNKVGVLIYLDGSDTHHEGEPIMTWGFRGFLLIARTITNCFSVLVELSALMLTAIYTLGLQQATHIRPKFMLMFSLGCGCSKAI